MQAVFFKVAKATIDLLQAREIAHLAENNLQVMHQHLTDTQSRFEVGEITRTNVSQAEARLAAAQADQIRANNDVAVAQAQFFEVVGVPPGHARAANLSPGTGRGFPGELVGATGAATRSAGDPKAVGGGRIGH